jgi:hypothetical protein
VFLLRCDEWEPNDSAIIHKRLATANLIDSPFTRAIAGLELDGEPAYMALECLSGENSPGEQPATAWHRTMPCR